MDPEAKELAGLRGNYWLRRSSCTSKPCPWLFISTSCLRGLRDPCQGESGPPVRDAILVMNHSQMENR